jgi:methylthioribose-1-phosphate isomerase
MEISDVLQEREDKGLPFLLQYENVAYYRDGEIFVLDRRVYPACEEFVRCRNYQEAARAIADMVTQSGGPRLVASLGMVSAAREARNLPLEEARLLLQQAAYTLSHARPTTSKDLALQVEALRELAENALARGEDPEQAVFAQVYQILNERYRNARKLATFCVDLLPEKVTILTQCFAETLIGFTLLVARERGKEVSLIVPDTRPYLQGARLTASVACDMGVPVTVITDNMPAYILSRRMAQVFISAADVITLDGHVVNKIGTFQIALAAHYHGVPYYVLGNPSRGHAKIDSVVIEERDPQEVLHAMGVRTTKPGVAGYYPAFDITPPHLVGAVVTSKGVFSPYDLARHFAADSPMD